MDSTATTRDVPTTAIQAEPERRPSVLRRWLRPSTAERRRRLRREVAALNVLGLLSWSAGRFWRVDLGGTATWRVVCDTAAFMLRTFQFHLGMLMLVVALVAAFVRMRVASVIALAICLLALAPTLSSMLPQSTPRTAGPAIRVLSFNLYIANRSPDAVLREILAHDAELVFTQEFTPAWQARISAALRSRYPHVIEVPQEDCFGSAVYSKLPFLGSPQTHLPVGPTGNSQIRAVFDLGGQIVAIYNVHLLPPVNLDYVRINRAEFCDLLRLLREERLPAIVCGDFNFTADSAQGDELRGAGFRDALDRAGWGPRWTWPAIGPLRFVPGLRLDHIYVNRALGTTKSAVGNAAGSDHRPVFAAISTVEP